MKWAEVGKQATFFHNGGASETYIGATWYQAYPQGEWWGMSHGEPFLMRSYAGKVEKFPAILADILDNKEVVVPCMRWRRQWRRTHQPCRPSADSAMPHNRASFQPV